MNDQKSTQGTQQKNPGGPTGGDNKTSPQSPNQQKPPADNERKSGTEQSEKAHRSNLAGDQDTDEPVETEEG
jgi:hypothetical protein